MDIKRYLIDRKEDIDEVEVFPRRISHQLSKDFVSAVVGPRRAGKTYFLYHLIKSQNIPKHDYVFINLEEVFDHINIMELPLYHQEIYGVLPKYIFLDEIQALEKWERQLYSLYERKRYILVVTGSSSKLLSKEIATQLRGRATTVKIYPFNFHEIFSIKGIDINRPLSSYQVSEIKHTIRKNIHSQFPDIVLGKINPRDFFRDYLDIIIYRDIIERYGIRSRYVLELLIKNIIDSNCSKFSIHKFFNTLKSQGLNVSKKTVYNFTRILEDVSMVFFLRKYTGGLRKSELTMPKAYLVDPGLYSYLVEKSFSKAMENTIFLELVKNGYEPNRNIFYYETRTGKEIDFLIKTDEKLGIIEVTQDLDEEHIKKTIHAAEELKNKEATIITWDTEETIQKQNVKINITPLWRFITQTTKQKPI